MNDSQQVFGRGRGEGLADDLDESAEIFDVVVCNDGLSTEFDLDSLNSIRNSTLAFHVGELIGLSNFKAAQHLLN